MNNYDQIAAVYDQVIGNRDKDVATILGLIRREMPDAQSVIDIGCGTGAITEQIARHYRVTGVDISDEMIQQAQKRSPEIDYLVGDMTNFRTVDTFDCAVCLFNAINQVTDYADWEDAFQTAAALLNPGGVYIFDINTLAKHEKFVSASPLYQSIGNADYDYVLRLSPNGTGYVCSVTVFEKQGDIYRRHHNDMHCNSFPVSQILKGLERHFTSAKAVLADGTPAGEDDDVVYFVARA